MAYSADGSLLAMEYYTDVIQGVVLWEMSEPMQPRAASEPFGTLTFPQSVAFSPNRQVMAVGNYEDAVQLWDVSDTDSFELWSDLPADQALNVWSMAFSPDNALLVTASYSAKVLVWDVLDPTAPQLLAGPLSGYSEGVARMQFLPNSQILATLSWDDTLHFWDLAQPRQPQRLGERFGNRITSFAVRADGLVLITGHENGDVRFWDGRNPAAPQPLGEAWHVAGEAVRLLALSADSRVLAVGLENSGQLQLWEVSNPAQMIKLGQPLKLDLLRGLTSHPAYPQLAAWQLETSPVLLDLDVESWQATLCQRAGRNLTPTEWRQYLGAQPYRATCPQWPETTE
jgi:WD40 repeat protein